MIERIAQAFIAQVRHVEDDPEPLHFAKQLATESPEIACRVRAVRIAAKSVMRRSDRAEPLCVCPFEMCGRQDGVRAFEAQDVSDRGSRFASAFGAARLRRDNLRLTSKRRLAAGFLPGGDMSIQPFAIANLHHLAA